MSEDHDEKWDPFAEDTTGLDTKQVQGPAYSTLEEWIDDWLAPNVLRPGGLGGAWCAQWWAHPEAAARLEALWMAWEAARTEGGEALSRWWTVDWASHWKALSSKTGTFNSCSATKHREVSDPLPCNPIPEWLSDDEIRKGKRFKDGLLIGEDADTGDVDEAQRR